ncbi:MAG: M23 family metallopeptidase [Candidatus Cryptobacteroides sp.]
MSRQNKDNKVENFRISLVDDKTHKQLWVVRFTRIGFLVSIISVVVFVCVAIFAIIAYTPVKTFIPGFPDDHTKRAAIQNAIKIDSLERIIKRWDLYSENLVKIIDGQEPVKIDSIIKATSIPMGQSSDPKYLASRDSLLRQNVQKEEKFNIGTERRKLPLEGMHFFTPLKGVISQEFDTAAHPYIDITAPANSVVMAVLDGTIVFAGWNDDSGYTIQIQHPNDIISIYSHTEKLLKKAGDKVKAGAPIALIANNGALAIGDHLHFELWYKGEAVDPTKYINF